MMTPAVNTSKTPSPGSGPGSYQFLYFSELIKRPICAGKIKDRIGRLTDLVFSLTEPYPEAVGIYIEHGWGKPTEFIPWAKVMRIEDDAIFVQPPTNGNTYPSFVDQPGWILVDKHLMGRTILDMDGRRIEVVNDVHLLESKGQLFIVHVDISFNGFLRRWGLGGIRWVKDQLISWKYVQPLSVEDAVSTDKVTLSVTRKQVLQMPGEDLADALEELSGKEQQALFSALDSEKAAEALVEAEPRAQRQIIANLRKEKAHTILSEMTIPQLADLFSVLPHEQMTNLMELLKPEQAERVQAILSDREAKAKDIMSSNFMTTHKNAKVGEILEKIRRSGVEPDAISYIYVISAEDQTLVGVVDLRELLLSSDQMTLGEIMVPPAVVAEENDVREDLAEMFAKYHYRMIPVVDERDHILGVIHFNDIMKDLVTRVKV
ncbi:MAG TPA: CBS domain-containing protein [Thermodesulfobacteriota bacterium]|jgi:CBS domain-containing protein|nr:CBS domain-containing protein [Thermodesulfobacteriota bacterium]